jgi:AraC-like DNA-binding protein
VVRALGPGSIELVRRLCGGVEALLLLAEPWGTPSYSAGSVHMLASRAASLQGLLQVCAPRTLMCTFATVMQPPGRPDDRPTWNSLAARLTGRGDVFGAVLRCYVRLTWRCDRPSMILNRLAQAGGILVEACARPSRRLRYPTAERCNAMVTEVFDARQIPEADRLEVTRATVAQRYAPLEMEFAADLGPMAAHFLLTELGDLVLCSSVSTAVKLHRTATLARDDLTPSVFVALQMTGSSVVVQGEREVVLRPGELVVYDSTKPFVLSDTAGMRQHKFRFPLDRVGLPADVLRQICATTLCPGHPIAELAAAYFYRLASRPASFERAGGEVVSEPSIELLRAVITTHLDAVELGKDSLYATLFVRIMEYVRIHLRDADLGAHQIAAEHHISVRHLYNILAANDVSLGDWIRTHRLAECRKEIGAAGSLTPLGAVARRWGFTDASSFARMFRAAYGMSPREWRAQNHPRTT